MRIATLLERYMTECAARMDLRYTFEFELTRSPDYYLAIEIDHFGKRHATVKIGKHFSRLNRTRKTLVVAHELGHLIAWGYTDAVENAIIGNDVATGFIRDAEEKFCDRFAAAVAPLLPRWGDV